MSAECPLRIAGEYALSTHGSTRASAYSMSNKILTHGDTVIAAWLESPGVCMVRALNRKTGALSDPVALGHTEKRDNHCGPAIVAALDGTIHAVIGAHHRLFGYRRTLRPWDISAWTEIEYFRPESTYPSLVVDSNDTLHLTARTFLPRGESPKLITQQRPRNGEWSEPKALVRPPRANEYSHYGNTLFVDPGDGLHLFFHVYHGQPNDSPIEGYLRSADHGATWTQSDGAPVQLIANRDTVENIIRDPACCFRGHGLAMDPEGRLYAFVTATGKAITSLFRLDGPKQWTPIDLLPVIDRYCPRHVCKQTSGMTFDRAGNLYVLATVALPEEGWAGTSNAVLLLHSTDRGETFTGLPITGAAPARGANWLGNLERVCSPRPLDGPPSILYTVGEQGSGCTPPELTTVRLVTLGGP